MSEKLKNGSGRTLTKFLPTSEMCVLPAGRPSDPMVTTFHYCTSLAVALFAVFVHEMIQAPDIAGYRESAPSAGCTLLTVTIRFFK